MTVGWFVSWPTSSQKLCYRDIAYFAAFESRPSTKIVPEAARKDVYLAKEHSLLVRQIK